MAPGISPRHEPIPISLADVARLARVSTATVSLALRGMGRISPRTRNRVRKVAEQLGYHPNLAASLLARQSHDHNVRAIPIALIGMVPPFASRGFVEFFSRYATQVGFQVNEPEPALCSDFTLLFRTLYHRGVRGIVVNHSFDARRISDQDAAHFSFLHHGYSLLDHRFHRVCWEVFQSTKSLWETAWARGYRRIGAALCRHPEPLPDDFARESAILGCERQYNTPHVPPYLGDHHDVPGHIQWIKEVKPDAIILFNSGTIYYLRDAGFRIPQDFALCCLHRSPTGDTVTGLYQDYHEIGQAAVHQIESMISRNETGFPPLPHSTLIDPTFQDDLTLPPVSAKMGRFVRKSKKKRKAKSQTRAS